MTQPEVMLVSQRVKEGLAEMERNLGLAAEQAREAAAELTPGQLQAWAAAQHISPAELAALLAYTHGPVPENLFSIILRSLREAEKLEHPRLW